MGLTETITALVNEGLRQSAEHAEKEGAMPTETPTATDSKSDIQAALTEAGIDFAKSWNRDKLVEAWNAANPDPDDQVSMSFGPTGTTFMTDAGYSPDKTSNNRAWFTFSPDQADSLLERLEGEIASQKSDENGSKATARNLERARDRIVTRLG